MRDWDILDGSFLSLLPGGVVSCRFLSLAVSPDRVTADEYWGELPDTGQRAVPTDVVAPRSDSNNGLRGSCCCCCCCWMLSTATMKTGLPDLVVLVVAVTADDVLSGFSARLESGWQEVAEWQVGNRSNCLRCRPSNDTDAFTAGRDWLLSRGVDRLDMVILARKWSRDVNRSRDDEEEAARSSRLPAEPTFTIVTQFSSDSRLFP